MAQWTYVGDLVALIQDVFLPPFSKVYRCFFLFLFIISLLPSELDKLRNGCQKLQQTVIIDFHYGPESISLHLCWNLHTTCAWPVMHILLPRDQQLFYCLVSTSLLRIECQVYFNINIILSVFWWSQVLLWFSVNMCMQSISYESWIHNPCLRIHSNFTFNVWESLNSSNFTNEIVLL